MNDYDELPELYAACGRLGLTCWPDAANFVRVRAPGRTADLVTATSARGVYVRDRSPEPGCPDCIRIGVVEHPRCGIAVPGEVPCAER